MAKWVFRYDTFVEEENAFIHFKDLSFQRGYGVFDFFRLMGNRPLFLSDHLDRFYFSAREMHLPVPLNKEALESAILELILKNNLPDTGIRISLTGGYSNDDFNIGKPAILISQHSFSPPREEQVQKGVRLFSYNYKRPLPHIKSIDYQMAVWLQPERIKAGADDILYAREDWISECPRSNFFLVTKENKLVTAAKGVLPGITRKKVLEMAREQFSVEERPISIEECKTAREAFITSTTKQILPVAAVDGIDFPQKEIALQLLQKFKATCEQEVKD